MRMVSERKNPEDRRSRFPVRFRRSEEPELPPGAKAFHVGILNERQSSRAATSSTQQSSAGREHFVTSKAKDFSFWESGYQAIRKCQLFC
jgi:hypothetical protein